MSQTEQLQLSSPARTPRPPAGGGEGSPGGVVVLQIITPHLKTEPSPEMVQCLLLRLQGYGFVYVLLNRGMYRENCDREGEREVGAIWYLVLVAHLYLSLGSLIFGEEANGDWH